MEDVDSLIARNAPIARTQKKRNPQYERCITATTTSEYLRMGGARKDLKWDIDNGFVMVKDRAPVRAEWEATVPRSPLPAAAAPAAPGESPRKRPKKQSTKALEVAAVEAQEAAAAPTPTPPSYDAGAVASLRPSYAPTPTRREIGGKLGGESTDSSSSDDDDDDDFSPGGGAKKPAACVSTSRSASNLLSDASSSSSACGRASRESDTDDDTPPLPAAVNQELVPPAELSFDGERFTGPPAAEPLAEELVCSPRTVHPRFVGVKIDSRKEVSSWSANIGVKRETEYLGSYHSPIAAAEAYDKRARELNLEGETKDRPVNFPREGETKALPSKRKSSVGPPAKRARTAFPASGAARPPAPQAPARPPAAPRASSPPPRAPPRGPPVSAIDAAAPVATEPHPAPAPSEPRRQRPRGGKKHKRTKSAAKKARELAAAARGPSSDSDTDDDLPPSQAAVEQEHSRPASPTRDQGQSLEEQLQDTGTRLRQRGRERDEARRERDNLRAENARLRGERDEALRERDAALLLLAGRLKQRDRGASL